MAERQLKGLCYNCDDKYFPGHKCKKQKLFMAISEDISEEDVETPLVSESPEITDITHPSNPPEVEPVISLNRNNTLIQKAMFTGLCCYS